jgi:hypothetical protein
VPVRSVHLLAVAAITSVHCSSLSAQSPISSPTDSSAVSLRAPRFIPIELTEQALPRQRNLSRLVSQTSELPTPLPSPPHIFPTGSTHDPGILVALPDHYGSVYIPVDNWIYPELVRLYELGYADTLYLGLRPWTRRSILHVLERSQEAILNGDSEEAKEIFAALVDELDTEREIGHAARPMIYGTESAYMRLMSISGTPLEDSFHLGQTIVNDYGRPYQHGFNAIGGFSSIAEADRFSLYVRAEYEHAPSAAGYSLALANQFSLGDLIGPYAVPNAPQATIPAGPISAKNAFRIVEANLSYHLIGHEISFGKSDAWLGPAAGASMAWSNNAENIYSFRINRVEPLRIPLLSRLTGPFRYDFFYGSLKGHTAPNNPYVHSEALSFQPTRNLQIGFQRTIIFGGEDHSPVTLHSFLKGFFSTVNTTYAIKFSRNDPGARFSSFNLSYRLPFVRHLATFYVDSSVHDDISPIDAPRRAAYRTGIDLAQFPRIPKLELRVEAVSTDPDISRSQKGGFFYVETVQLQGYTNNGMMLSDWIGREAKGGQAWLTYHLAPKEWLQIEYLNKKIPNDFVGGTTQNQFKVSVVKRFYQDIELNASVQYEGWKAPIYMTGKQSDTTAAIQVTWFPKLKTSAFK